MVDAMIRKNEVLPAIVGFTIAAFLTYGIYLWRTPAPIEYFHRYASQTVVKAGDRVTITWSEVRRSTCRSIIHRRLISSDKTVTLFEVMHNPPKPSNIEIVSMFSFLIPSGLPEGPLTYRAHAEFQCNIVQRLFGGPDFVLPDIVFSYTRGNT